MKSLFPKNQESKDISPGLRGISKLLDEVEEQRDFWLVYELGGSSLTKQLYEVKGEFFKGERIYHV